MRECIRGETKPATSFRPSCRKVTVEHDNDVCARGSTDGLSQATHRQHAAIRDFSRPSHEDVDVTRQLHMLKAIVQQVYGGAESSLREHARDESILSDQHRGSWQLPGKHEGLVAGLIDLDQYLPTIRYDNDTIAPVSAAVAASENCRPLALIEEPLGNERDHGRLTRSSDAQIANADDRLPQPSAGIRMTLEPAPPKLDDLCIEEIKQWGERV